MLKEIQNASQVPNAPESPAYEELVNSNVTGKWVLYDKHNPSTHLIQRRMKVQYITLIVHWALMIPLSEEIIN